MTLIKLVDARRGLNLKCRELFQNEKIAESIYRFLCDGIDECDDATPTDVPDRKMGKWIRMSDADGVYWACSECGENLPRVDDFDPQFDLFHRLKSIEKTNFCPNCGAEMEKEEDDE